MRRPFSILIPLLALVGILAAACSSGGGDGPAPNTPVVPGENGAPDADGEPSALSASIIDGWNATVVGSGIKPAVALDNSGSPAIAYLFEDPREGFVMFATAAEGWASETVVEGYFYGPIDLAFDLQNRPNIVYHDHQAAQFEDDLGDLTYALRDGAAWQITAVLDDGHDGWDSTIVISADGIVRAAGIDPAQFGRSDGVEYYELQDGVWSVTAIGSGPIPYEFNVSLAVSPDGLPALTYYANADGDLIMARFDGSGWNLETVASEGDVGKFSSLQFDAEGRPHISFFEDSGSGSGHVLYAIRNEDTWTVEEIGELEDVALGQIGARRNSSLALDAQGVPHVIFSDRNGVHYATRSDAGWEVEEIVTAGARPLGQLVSLRLDDAGRPHVAFYEVTNTSPLDGLIVYLTRS